jgi:tetratricopeptide (TPR) repeat protein
MLAALVAAAMHAPQALTASDSPLDCEAEFAALANEKKYPDLAARIARWASLEPKCGGDGAYELRLGALYTAANRDQEARAAFTRGLRVKSDYVKETRLSLFDLDLRAGDLERAQKGAADLIAEFPQWRGGHRALGQVRLAQGRFEESVTKLEAANAIEPSSGTYTLLTMAYYKLDRYRETAQSMQRALRLDRDALLHTQAVVAAAYSLVALGYPPEADDLLTRHRLVQPDASEDPYYVAAVTRVRSELAEAEKKTDD